MDFVNQTINQLRDLFGSMTPGARLTAGLLLAVVVVSLGYLVNQGTSGPDTYLFGAEPLTSSQIARMEGAMSQAGLGDYTVEGNHIKIPRGQKATYIAAIADAGELPPDIFMMMDEALAKGSIFDDSSTKKQRMKAAREKQLSLIIGQMSWVDRAMVLYDVQEERGLRASRQASASISVMPAVGEMVTAQRSRNLKSFVASAHNIPITNVSITNLGSDSMVGSDGIGADDFDHPLYSTKAKVEKKLRNELIAQLDFIPGVRVQVKADIDNTLEKRSVQVNPEEKTAMLKRQETLDESKQSAGGNGGAPGINAQGPGRNGTDATLAKQDSSEKKTEQTTIDNVVGTRTEEVITAGLKLQSADASVAIPQSYVVSVFKMKALDETGTEPDKISPQEMQATQADIKGRVEEIVKPLLPSLRIGEDEYKQANITFFQDLAPAEIAAPSMASNIFGYAERYANTLAMAGVALVSLVMLRSIANGGGGKDDLPSVASLRLDTGSGEAGSRSAGGAGGGGDIEEERQKLKLRKAETLKDDLAEMVSGDPDAAAEILKNWISNAA